MVITVVHRTSLDHLLVRYTVLLISAITSSARAPSVSVGKCDGSKLGDIVVRFGIAASLLPFTDMVAGT